MKTGTYGIEDCKQCGYTMIPDDGEWLGEREGQGGVILITSATCCNCGNTENIPAHELTGM